MLILQKVSEDKEFRERDRLKVENEPKEIGGTNGLLPGVSLLGPEARKII